MQTELLLKQCNMCGSKSLTHSNVDKEYNQSVCDSCGHRMYSKSLEGLDELFDSAIPGLTFVGLMKQLGIEDD